MSANRPTDPIYDSIGESGTWQVYMLLLLSFSKFSVGWHQLATVFLSLPIDFWCKVPGNDTNACSDDCKELEFDRSVIETTMREEFGLICSRYQWAHYEQTIFMLGILLGNITFGIWADRQGRRIALVTSAVLQLVAGCLAALAPWFFLFCFFRFLTAVATGGNMLITFCMLMELFGPLRREWYTSVVFQLPFNFGHMLVPVYAYFLRNFRWYQFAMSVFSILYLPYFCLVPESPRWQILNGQEEEAIMTLEKAAIINKMPTDGIRDHVESAIRARAAKEVVKKAKVFDLLRTPNLRRNTLCILFNWFAVGFNFFGVSQYVGRLGGNIFINVAVSGFFSIPGLIASVPACRYLGRKPGLAIANLSVTLSMLIFVLIPKPWEIPRLLCSSIAVCGAFMVFPTCYLYAGEIFPTVARNSGIGAASMLARVGAMLSAHISSLLRFGYWIPPTTFATVAFVAFLLTLLLPETLNEPLPETLLDAENFKKKT